MTSHRLAHADGGYASGKISACCLVCNEGNNCIQCRITAALELLYGHHML